MAIAKPKHLDPPDEVTRDGKTLHIYAAHTDGKRLIESLIWLCGRYHRVVVEAISEPGCNDARTELHCWAIFDGLDTDN